MLAAGMGTVAYLADLEDLRRLEGAGVAAWTAGMLLLGAATTRARVAMVLTALALSPWVPRSAEGSYSGAAANGMDFLALGAARSCGRKATVRSTRPPVRGPCRRPSDR